MEFFDNPRRLARQAGQDMLADDLKPTTRLKDPEHPDLGVEIYDPEATVEFDPIQIDEQQIEIIPGQLSLDGLDRAIEEGWGMGA